MSDLSSNETSALRDLLEKLLPSMALALSEQVGREARLEALNIQSVPLQTILTNPDNVFQTVFSLSQPLSIENVFLMPNDIARMMVDVMEGNDGTEPPLTLSEKQIERLSIAMNGFARGFATAMTNFGNDAIEIESCTSNMGSLTLPPSFALESTVVEAHLLLSILNVLDTEVTFLFTPELVRALIPDTGGDGQSDGILTEEELAAMLGEIGGGAGMGLSLLHNLTGRRPPSRCD